MHAGVMNSGYHGAVGALIKVMKPHGLRLFKDARIAQLVFHRMSEKTEGYKGVYQGSGDGTEQANDDSTGLKGFNDNETVLLQY